MNSKKNKNQSQQNKTKEQEYLDKQIAEKDEMLKKGETVNK